MKRFFLSTVSSTAKFASIGWMMVMRPSDPVALVSFAVASLMRLLIVVLLVIFFLLHVALIVFVFSSFSVRRAFDTLYVLGILSLLYLSI